MLKGYFDMTGTPVTFEAIEDGQGVWQVQQDGMEIGMPVWMVRGLAKKAQAYVRYCDYSATTLADEPKRVIYKMQHDYFDDIPFWAAFGSVGHGMFESGVRDGGTETPFRTTVLGKTVGGKPDYYDDHHIEDIKTIGAYQLGLIAKGEVKHEWLIQFSIYRWLLSLNGFPNIAEDVVVNLFVRDHRDYEYRDYLDSLQKVARGEVYRSGFKKGQPMQPKGYVPQYPVVMFKLKTWTPAETAKFVTAQVQRLEAIKDGYEPMPDCTDLWQGADGVPKRCTRYCPFGKSGVCAQGHQAVTQLEAVGTQTPI